MHNISRGTTAAKKKRCMPALRPACSAAATRFAAIILTITFIAAALSGCSGRELDSMAVVTCLEVTQGNGQYQILAEIVRLDDPEAEPGQNTEIISASGCSLEECIDKLNEAEVLHIYLGHLRLIILNSSIFNDETSALRELADFAVDNPDIRFSTALAASGRPFGEAVCGESASTGNLGIDLSNRIHELDAHSELCDLINYISGTAGPVELPLITVSDMNNKKVTIVKNDEHITLKRIRKETDV